MDHTTTVTVSVDLACANLSVQRSEATDEDPYSQSAAHSLRSEMADQLATQLELAAVNLRAWASGALAVSSFESFESR